LVNCKKIKKKGLILWDEEFEWKKSFKRKLIMSLTSFINRNSDYILVPSFKHKEWQLKLGVDEKKVVLFPNVTNLTPKMVNNEKVNEIIEKYNLEGKKIIMYVGRLIKLKGIQYLIDAYYLLLKEFPQFKRNTVLMIIGDGDYKEKLEKKSKKVKEIGGNIIFTGKIDNKNLPNYYSISYIGVVPSININGCADSCPLVVNEFMVFGKPVIATDKVGASYMLINNYKTGVIVKEKDVNELKNAILWFLNLDDESYIKIQKNIYKTIYNINSFDKVIDILKEVLK
jgi:glycosyltransferase involved in cell wall biosynthesis